MSKKDIDFLQKGEQNFIDNVVKAIIKKDLSKKHYLLNDNGIMRYESIAINEKRFFVEFKYDDGRPVKVVCIFGKELIEDFHYKAGSDELAKPWAKKSVKSVIAHGKKVAEVVYNK